MKTEPLPTTAPTWQTRYVSGWQDRMGGIRIHHKDGADVYIQPGDDAADLANTLNSPGIKQGNIAALLCDQLDGIEAEPETPVIFRRWPMERVRDKVTGRIAWEGGDVVAIFPTETGTYERHTCSCYQHLGQHSACDGRGFVNRTILATPEQYADLKAELEGLGYRLKIYTRWQSSFDTARYVSLKAADGAGSH